MIALLLAAILGASPPQPLFLNAIRKIVCDDGQGTAFVVGKDVLMTANHVATGGNCIDEASGQPVKTYFQDSAHDLALMTTDTHGSATVSYSCERFKPRQRYFSYGYGMGAFMMNPLISDKDYTNDRFYVEDKGFQKGMRHLKGLIVPGQSGGPVVDADGVAHGVNNVTDSSRNGYVYELADTPLCKR